MRTPTEIVQASTAVCESVNRLRRMIGKAFLWLSRPKSTSGVQVTTQVGACTGGSYWSMHRRNTVGSYAFESDFCAQAREVAMDRGHGQLLAAA